MHHPTGNTLGSRGRRYNTTGASQLACNIADVLPALTCPNSPPASLWYNIWYDCWICKEWAAGVKERPPRGQTRFTSLGHTLPQNHLQVHTGAMTLTSAAVYWRIDPACCGRISSSLGTAAVQRSDSVAVRRRKGGLVQQLQASQQCQIIGRPRQLRFALSIR